MSGQSESRSGWESSALTKDLLCPVCLMLDKAHTELSANIRALTNPELCESHIRLLGSHTARLTSTRRCTACLLLDDWTLRLLRQVDPFQLCFRHLTALKDVDPMIYWQVARRRAEWLAERLSLLKEFFRKEDYRFRHEPRGPEQTTYLDVLAFLAGPPPTATGE
jgi:hypothetical protein